MPRHTDRHTPPWDSESVSQNQRRIIQRFISTSDRARFRVDHPHRAKPCSNGRADRVEQNSLPARRRRIDAVVGPHLGDQRICCGVLQHDQLRFVFRASHLDRGHGVRARAGPGKAAHLRVGQPPELPLHPAKVVWVLAEDVSHHVVAADVQAVAVLGVQVRQTHGVARLMVERLVPPREVHIGAEGDCLFGEELAAVGPDIDHVRW